MEQWISGGSEHWSEQKEEVKTWHLALLFFLFRILPPLVLGILAYPVGFCYFLFSKKGRRESRRFLDQLSSFTRGSTGERKKLSSLRHIIAFALTIVEKVEAWGGRIPFKRIHFQDDDITKLISELEQGKGAVLLCSHLGNTELLRALADYHRTGVSRKIPVISVADFEVTAGFNRMLAKLNPRSSFRIISAKTMGPDSVIAIKEETEQGGLAVIAGERTSHSGNHFFSFPFLGKEALFPLGSYLLAALMEVPVYAVFALRRKDLSPLPEYNMHVHLMVSASGSQGSESASVTRRERKRLMENWAREFAALLEGYCLQHPYQWYNFYDFWAAEKPEAANDGSPQD
jgi:predicted LPLAT superfamily acyltransferase